MYTNRMKKITLSKGTFALIDDEDAESLSHVKWYFNAQVGYAHDRKRYMHRVITGAKKGQYVDHINGDKLDNRRSNLRLCTNAENSRNRRRGSNATYAGKPTASKYRGVAWSKQIKRWIARVCRDGKNEHIGCFASEEAAARAYDRRALELHGSFASLNFKEARWP